MKFTLVRCPCEERFIRNDEDELGRKANAESETERNDNENRIIDNDLIQRMGEGIPATTSLPPTDKEKRNDHVVFVVVRIHQTTQPGRLFHVKLGPYMLEVTVPEKKYTSNTSTIQQSMSSPWRILQIFIPEQLPKNSPQQQQNNNDEKITTTDSTSNGIDTTVTTKATQKTGTKFKSFFRFRGRNKRRTDVNYRNNKGNVVDTIELNEEEIYACTEQVNVLVASDDVIPGSRFRVNIIGQPYEIICPMDFVAQKKKVLTISFPPAKQGYKMKYAVTIAPGIKPGGSFIIQIPNSNHRVKVTCPPNVKEGEKIHVEVPMIPNRIQTGSEPSQRENVIPVPLNVILPEGIEPLEWFAFIAATGASNGRGGIRCITKCPENKQHQTKQGEDESSLQIEKRILKVTLPWTYPNRTHVPPDITTVPLISNNQSNDWKTYLRMEDFKFQWLLTDEKGKIDSERMIKHPAYIRKIIYNNNKKEDDDKKYDEDDNDGNYSSSVSLEFVPMTEASLISTKITHPSKAGEYHDLSGDLIRLHASSGTFHERIEWFQDMCSRCMTTGRFIRINIRRSHLLEDSLDAVLSIGQDSIRKLWRFEWIGESGISGGGLAREWFHEVSYDLFDPKLGLVKFCKNDNKFYMTINPQSELVCGECHLDYFHFMGRFIGRAIFSCQLVPCYFAQFLYKHLLGHPIQLDDLVQLDSGRHYKHLTDLRKMSQVDAGGNNDDITKLGLTFQINSNDVDDDDDGSNANDKKLVELVEGGANLNVTNENVDQYIKTYWQYKLMTEIRLQLTAILKGFHEVVPEELLMICTTHHDLQLLLSGMIPIDVDEWKEITDYSGSFETLQHKHVTCMWFWEILSDHFDDMQRARVLQMVTGSAMLPSSVSTALKFVNGEVKFRLHGDDTKGLTYPQTHPNENRLDLPLDCSSKTELQEKLEHSLALSRLVGSDRLD